MFRANLALVCSLSLALFGCASAPPKQSGEENNFNSTPSGPAVEEPSKWEGTSSGGSGSSESGSSGDTGGLNAEQREQMEIALRRGGEKAAQCPQSTGNEDVPRGKGEVKVTFDGKKGRITEVSVGSPWAGTAIEQCIKRSFIGEIVLPFDGDALEVPYTVEIKPKAGAAAPTPKKK